MAKKRSVDGKEKQAKAAGGTQPSKTPNARQPSTNSNQTKEPRHNPEEDARRKKQKLDNRKAAVPLSKEQPPQKPSIAQQTGHVRHSKLPQLPDHVSIKKRPIRHPAPPSPFSSASNPKTLYITHSTPFIPTLKRVRRLLTEITKRHKQSESSQKHSRFRQRHSNPAPTRSGLLEANGRLRPADVEKEIAEGSTGGRGGVPAIAVGEEEVFLKATGRAIERALQIGVHFQGEDDCRVRIEMGSVKAIDDIQRPRNEKRTGNDEEEQVVEKKKQTVKDEDIPETRIRTLSSVTVIVGLK
ncbi:unnamed protein product [Periconia digitata]|uniref:Uncharacterized protein n=1 Tax=Periconia digitata TaxID=1303443 RepID=A0A9W4UHS6_9PLEO|nr:unnamed protein product [Periconia digitata]